MSETPDELEPFPADGPASLSGVKLRVGIDEDDESDDVELLDHVAAVNRKIRRLPIATEARGEDDWAASPDIILGATMLAARLWRRKKTSGGVEILGDTVAYVRRNDPDVADLLGLGEHGKPDVG